MKQLKRALIAFLCAALPLGCTGCAEGTLLSEDHTRRIGVVLKTMDSEHWQEIRSGMENTAKEHGAALTLLYPSNEWAEEEQAVFIRDMLASDIDALIVAPCNSTSTGWFADQAAEQGLPLFTADTRAIDRDIPYIGSDNKTVGAMAADYLVEHVGPGASCAVIAGAAVQAQTVDRVGEFRRRMQERESAPLAVRMENSGFADAMETTETLLEQGVRGIFCASAAMGLGAAAARQERGADELCIIAVDTQDDALKAVQEGSLDALITQSGYEIGEKAIETVLRVLDGEKAGNVYVESRLITADNIADFLEERGNQR